MRKFIFSGSLISAVFGGLSALRSSRKSPRDWRLALLWISWAITVVIAVDSVLEQSRAVDELKE